MDLSHVVEAYKFFQQQGLGDKFFLKFESANGKQIEVFDLLMGQTYIREAILAGKSAEEIRTMWQEDIKHFKEQRRKYLLYAK